MVILESSELLSIKSRSVFFQNNYVFEKKRNKLILLAYITLCSEKYCESIEVSRNFSIAQVLNTCTCYLHLTTLNIVHQKISLVLLKTVFFKLRTHLV